MKFSLQLLVHDDLFLQVKDRTSDQLCNDGVVRLAAIPCTHSHLISLTSFLHLASTCNLTSSIWRRAMRVALFALLAMAGALAHGVEHVLLIRHVHHRLQIPKMARTQCRQFLQLLLLL